MMPFIGNLLLWSSLFFAFFQIIVFNNKKNIYYKFNQPVIYALLFCILGSFFSLMFSYIISDFSVKNVFQNSHTTKPLLYKIAAVWGNHEGSMLLWILVLAIFNYFIFKIKDKNNALFISKSLTYQGIIIAGFLLFTLITSNPFQRIFPIPQDGMGFNPILQDPALAIHPPLLYIGYVGFSAAFSLGIAAMNTHENEMVPWYRYMKPFVLAAWTFLTIGITFGSIWAYYELGWGGFWFWDPVENASFMPWLLGTALIHSLIVVDKKKSLQNWVLLLSILSFLLSVIGTFLVRSGILTSVHTFALDPERGIYILTFMGILGIYSLSCFAINSKKFVSKNYISFLSREGSILVNNLIMIVVCSTVFLATIYPLLIEAISNNKISVGEPFYNLTVVPIIFPAILIMGIGPLLSWNKINVKKTLKQIFPSLTITIIFGTLFINFYKETSFFGLIGILLSFWIISNLFVDLFKKYYFKNIIANKYSKGMFLSHLGVALLILGITGSSVWKEEKITRMKVNDTVSIHEYNIVFKEINKFTISNYISLKATFEVYNKKNDLVTKLEPENRFYPISNNSTTEASIHTNIARDLYMVLGDGNYANGWVIRIYHNPLVMWIWIGAIVIFIGGLISIKNNLNILKKTPL